MAILGPVLLLRAPPSLGLVAIPDKWLKGLFACASQTPALRRTKSATTWEQARTKEVFAPQASRAVSGSYILQ